MLRFDLPLKHHKTCFEEKSKGTLGRNSFPETNNIVSMSIKFLIDVETTSCIHGVKFNPMVKVLGTQKSLRIIKKKIPE